MASLLQSDFTEAKFHKKGDPPLESHISAISDFHEDVSRESESALHRRQSRVGLTSRRGGSSGPPIGVSGVNFLKTLKPCLIIKSLKP